ncbi:DUF1156 domain-containing protein [Actinotalea sp. Marseille-Q4924]|uniref:DUF1156 domain-containing protein n=1 Tax=Actinotalea sp. Marseille-Q4924 TaxID=2866571 RepID=UPI001CE44CA9|nr:DUF1156 domain-containing protein [Actinotalea sp. Marseille-Q4924]
MTRRKLIEVSLPLEDINRALKAEKARKVGKPQHIHHWWARRPITAARAVLFAQLVDDPSSNPDRFPTEASVRRERARLHDLIRRLIQWDAVNDRALMREAHAEIVASMGTAPTVLDPFTGGGAIPIEAQRLGLGVEASDLNPVAAILTRALVEIPPRFAGNPPVSPSSAGRDLNTWPGATGLAEDVRRYGELLRERAKV